MLGKERLKHLNEYIDGSFSTVAFDQITRQMEKHEISSKYTIQRINEVFLSMLFQERELYKSDLTAQLKYQQRSKQNYTEKIKSKQKKIDKFISNAVSENNEARKRLETVKMRFDFLNKRNKNGVVITTNKNTKVDNEINKLSHPVSLMKNNINGLKEEIQKLRTDHKYFKEVTFQQNQKTKSVFEQKYNEFKKKTFMSPVIAKRDNDLVNEKERTKKMKDALQNVIDYVNSLQKSNNQDDPITLDNITNGGFRIALKSAFNATSEKAKKELGVAFKADDGKSEVIIQELSHCVDNGLNEVKKKYDYLITKQKIRIQKIQQELDNAHKQLNQMKMSPSENIDIMNQLQKAEKSLSKTQEKTDQKMKLLQSKSVRFNK